MLNSQEEVFSFYVQDIVYACRNVQDKILRMYRSQCARKINVEMIAKMNIDIEEVLDFVISVPKVYSTRKFIVTGANNDQIFIADWQFLKETFQDYINKITKHLKFYYTHIGKFYTTSGDLDENIIIKIGKKLYTLDKLNTNFTLAISYLFDVSPLVYYDKFKDTLK